MSYALTRGCEYVARGDILKDLIRCVIERRHLRRVLLSLSMLVTNSVATLCIVNLIHLVNSIGDEEQCYSTEDFLHLAAMVFPLVSALSVFEIQRIGRKLEERATNAAVGCSCKKCGKILSSVLAGIAPAAATGAALTGSIHTAIGLVEAFPCDEFTAFSIVPGIIAGLYVWVYRSLAHANLLVATSLQNNKSRIIFRTLGTMLKHIPVLSGPFSKHLADIFRERTEGTTSKQDLTTDIAWCIAYLVLLVVMGFADSGYDEFARRQIQVNEKTRLLEAKKRYNLVKNNQAQEMSVSWLKFLLAFLAAGSYGVMAAPQMIYPLIRHSDDHQDSPRFPAEYDHDLFYGLSSIGVVCVMCHYIYTLFIGLHVFRTKKESQQLLEGVN